MPGLMSPRTSAPRGGAGAQVTVVIIVVLAAGVGGFFLLRGRGKRAAPPPPPPPIEKPLTEMPAAPVEPAADKPEPKEAAPAPAPAAPASEDQLEAAMKADPQGPAGRAAALALGDALYARCFAREPKDRTQWERTRAAYSAALAGIADAAVRKQTVARLDELNRFLICTSMATADSVAHKVEPGETIEKIAAAYGLPKDCALSIARINRMAPERLRAGETLKVIKPLNLEVTVSKKHLRLTALLNGYFFGEFPVGIGKDDATPAGEFVTKAGGKDKNPNWTKTLEDGRKVVYKFGDPENILGTRWIGLEGKEDVVGLGLHGTTKPETVPGRVSAGCIRMHNADVELLYDFIPDGTKVIITEQ